MDAVPWEVGVRAGVGQGRKWGFNKFNFEKGQHFGHCEKIGHKAGI